MKKMFTLLFAVGLFTMAQAQPGTRDNRQNDRRDDGSAGQWDKDKGYDNDRNVVISHNPYDKDDLFDKRISPERRRDMEIAKINREFDLKIQRVKNSFFMSRFEKQRQIRFLQDQRQREIRMVYAKFNKKNRFDDRYDGTGRRF
jgi:hypothetical protein